MKQERDIFITALMFFTRIPIPSWIGYTYDPAYLSRASRYFSLIGWLVGAVSAMVLWGTTAVFPPMIAVLLAITASILLTGAFHEDGWADVCDGFGGGMTKMRVLEIMKDSRLGTYGTIGLFLMLGSKATALYYLIPSSVAPLLLIAGHSVSRLAASTLIYFLSYVRENEDSKAKPLATEMSLASLLMLAVLGVLPLFLLPWPIWWSLLPITAVTWLMSRWFVKRIGGYTGDCLGAVQQISEEFFYLSALVILV